MSDQDSHALDRSLAERLLSHRAITRELHEQDSLFRAMSANAARGGRPHIPRFGGIGGAIGSVGDVAGGASGLIEQYNSSRERTAEAEQATMQMSHELRTDARHFNKAARSATGSSERGALVEAEEDAIDEFDLREKQLRKQMAGAKDGKFRKVGGGFAQGAAYGAMIGSFGGPVGMAIGGLVGGVIGGVTAYNEQKSTAAENQKQLAEIEKTKAEREAAQKKHIEERKKDLAKESSIMERMQRGDVRGARQQQDEMTWLKTYRQVASTFKEGDKDGEAAAERAADVSLSESQRERAGDYSHFITSRTSGAAGARIAALAAGEGRHEGERDHETGAIQDLHETVKNQGQTVTDTATRKNFSRS